MPKKVILEIDFYEAKKICGGKLAVSIAAAALPQVVFAEGEESSTHAEFNVGDTFWVAFGRSRVLR
ncbi:MAG: hypothetical protein ACI4WS_12465 [Oscillospiraceae bacterium]